MGDSFSLGVIFSFISTLLISTGYIHLAVRNVQNEIKHFCPLYITQLRHISTYTLWTSSMSSYEAAKYDLKLSHILCNFLKNQEHREDEITGGEGCDVPPLLCRWLVVPFQAFHASARHHRLTSWDAKWCCELRQAREERDSAMIMFMLLQHQGSGETDKR